MIDPRWFQRRRAAAVALAALVALLCVVPWLVRPSTASAQIYGGYGYGYGGLGYNGYGYNGLGYNGYGYGGLSGYGSLGGYGYGYGYNGYGYGGYGNSACSGGGYSTACLGSYGTSYGSSYGCGTSLFGGSSSCLGGAGSCAGRTLQFGQSCSNGQIYCSGGAPPTALATPNASCSGAGAAPGAATSLAHGSTYCATTHTYIPAATCLGTAATGSASASVSATGSGSVTCPGGGYAQTLANCGGSSDVTASTSTGTTSAAGSGNTISLGNGWNLIGGPSGTTVTGVSGSLYTFQANDTNYETVPTTTQFKGGAGYWVDVSGSATLTLSAVSGGSATVQLPAGQWVMIGNPGTTPATVSGADTVLVYDPSTGKYSQSTTLPAGAGGWAESNAGGTATITNAPS